MSMFLRNYGIDKPTVVSEGEGLPQAFETNLSLDLSEMIKRRKTTSLAIRDCCLFPAILQGCSVQLGAGSNLTFLKPR